MDDTTGSRTARAVAVGRAVGVGGHRDEHVATLAVLRDRSSSGTWLVVTTVTPALFDPPVLGRPLAGPARWLMAHLSEPVRLAESDAAFAARLARHGFTQRRVTGPRQWAEDAGLQLAGPHLDERLHVAELAGDR